MTTQERFLHYITYDTQSDEDSALTPSTPKQKRLGARLAQELQEMGLEHAHLAENGAVYGWLPATAGKEDLPVLALIAHMDTAPRVPGENVKAKIVRYEGGDLVLNAELGIVMTPANFPDLNDQVGKELIVTDGTMLLGADDKAGVAEIFSAVAYLAEHPELSHGRVAVCITPDEEVGRGADYIDLDLLGADFAYTVDGGPLGTLEYENFNAASAEVVIHGVNIHPGDAKNKMKNACLMAAELIAMVPPAESPAHTEGYEGFYHLCGMEGDESEAKLSWILRDHDWDSFDAAHRGLPEREVRPHERRGPPHGFLLQHEGKDPAPPGAAGLGQSSLPSGGGGAGGRAHPGRHGRGAAEFSGPALPESLHRRLPLPWGL